MTNSHILALNKNPSLISATHPSSTLSNFEILDSQPTTPFTFTPLPSPVKPALIPLPNKELYIPMANEYFAPFYGNKYDENPETFLHSFYWHMGNADEDTKLRQFWNYLEVDGPADKWYENLSDGEKKTWVMVKTTFQKRWPRRALAKKTVEEYEHEIMELHLQMEDLGKKEKVAGRYMHMSHGQTTWR